MPLPALLLRPRVRLGLVALVLAAAAVAASRQGALSPAELREWIGDGGAGTAAAFVALYAVLTVAMFPGSILSLAGGALFGAALGSALTVAGATIGATAAFLAGRRLSRPAVESIAGPRMRRVDDHLGRRGLAATLVLRLVPLVPFNVLNYAAGATAVRTRHYVAGTAVGIVPGSIAFATAGASAGDPTSPAFLGALALLAALVAGGSIAARRLRR